MIKPDTLGKEWSDFDACEELLIQGKISTEKIVEELMKLIKEKNSCF